MYGLLVPAWYCLAVIVALRLPDYADRVPQGRLSPKLNALSIG